MYLPKSKYTGNLYSNGTLYKDDSPYFGYYFVTKNGLYFTGNYPGDGPNLPLSNVKYLDETYDYEYSPTIYYVVNSDSNYISNDTPIPTPQQSFRFPTESDYKIGEYIRYFAKKTNENIYYETQTQFTSNSLYIGFEIPWLLTGDKETVYNTNRRMVFLKEQQLQISGLGFFLKDNYIKFYKPLPSPPPALVTSNLGGLTPQTSNLSTSTNTTSTSTTQTGGVSTTIPSPNLIGLYHVNSGTNVSTNGHNFPVREGGITAAPTFYPLLAQAYYTPPIQGVDKWHIAIFDRTTNQLATWARWTGNLIYQPSVTSEGIAINTFEIEFDANDTPPSYAEEYAPFTYEDTLSFPVGAYNPNGERYFRIVITYIPTDEQLTLEGVQA